jgi:hypothetical protein
MEDLVRYLDEIVDPTVKDLEAEPTSLRKTFLACVAVFHAVDYLAYPRNSRELRNLWREQSPAFAVVDKVAHAFKHVVTGRPQKPNHLKAADVVSRPLAFYEVAAYGFSPYSGGVTLADDPTVDVLDSIRRAVAFLRKQAR